jgi:hypothetical protein
MTHIFTNISISKAKIYLLYAFLVSMWITAPQSLHGQSVSGKNKVLIIGQVTNTLNGGPVKQQEVYISNDSVYEPQSYYYKKVVTDNEGYYYDTIYTMNEKGSFLIKTIDYLNNHHDTAVYYRFTWGADNILFPNFVIPIKPLPVFYQANFYYVRNPDGQNDQEYHFYDITNAENIVSWLWDFGDGTHSVQQHPVHIFDETGLYRVKLTVEILDLPGSQAYVTEMVKVVNVVVKEYFHFGGHVYAGYFPIDYGEAFLYKIEDNKAVPIDTAFFNSQFGHYCFYQLIEGEYIVKADLAPNSGLYNQFMTTYYSNKLHWINADTIFHYSTSFDYHIHLMANNQVLTGPGTISGKIIYSPGEKEGSPAFNMSIFLYDTDDNLIAFCHSDEDGLFQISGLDLGSYLLYAEVTGKNTTPVQINLDEMNTHISQVELVIEIDEVFGSIAYAGIDNADFFYGISKPYPNPASEIVHIDLVLTEMTAFSCSVLDSQGKLISTNAIAGKAGDHTISIHTSDLPNGLYFIYIQRGDGKVVTRKFIR